MAGIIDEDDFAVPLDISRDTSSNKKFGAIPRENIEGTIMRVLSDEGRVVTDYVLGGAIICIAFSRTGNRRKILLL